MNKLNCISDFFNASGLAKSPIIIRWNMQQGNASFGESDNWSFTTYVVAKVVF